MLGKKVEEKNKTGHWKLKRQCPKNSMLLVKDIFIHLTLKHSFA